MTREELINYLLYVDERYTRTDLECKENKELFDCFLTWHGIIGFTDDIWDTVYNLVEPFILEEYLDDPDKYKEEFEERNLL